MAKHPNSKVFVRGGQVTKVELWENRDDGTPFRKIGITRQPTRFMVTTNFLGRGKDGLNLPKTITKAVEGFEAGLAKTITRLFELEGTTVREVMDIASSHFNLDMQ